MERMQAEEGMIADLPADLTRSGLNLIGQALSIFDADLRLAVASSALTLQRMPAWHRYDGLPVATRRLRAAA